MDNWLDTINSKPPVDDVEEDDEYDEEDDDEYDEEDEGEHAGHDVNDDFNRDCWSSWPEDDSECDAPVYHCSGERYDFPTADYGETITDVALIDGNYADWGVYTKAGEWWLEDGSEVQTYMIRQWSE